MQDDAGRVSERGTPDTEVFDLIVVGAGIAGLNALFAAVQYLPRGARILVLDQKDKAGGMWNTAYDYVRLHQPHPMFTVGNLTWRWSKPRDYLAARDEVQAHLAAALEPIAKNVMLDVRFGQTVTQCQEIEAAEGPRAEVIYHETHAAEAPHRAIGSRAVFAPGLDYRPAEPLALSSGQVVSITPQDLRATLASAPDAPLYVVGGGKTGMDTVLAALAEDSERRITLLKGRGTNFINRTRFLPMGLGRWASGKLISALFRDVAEHFNGDNEDDLIDYVRRAISTDPSTKNGVFLYGLQSEEEHRRIRDGLAETLPDYLVDVSDTASGPRLAVRDGPPRDVEPGSIFVNCTGSFFRTAELGAGLPVISPKETVLSINARFSFHFLTSVAGFFTTHALYRGALRGVGYYALDQEALFRKNRNAWVGASSAQAYMNQVIAVQTLPLSLLDRCGLDLDRWYPLPRRMAGLMRMKSGAKRDIEHCRRVLDRVGERFDVLSAPVT